MKYLLLISFWLCSILCIAQDAEYARLPVGYFVASNKLGLTHDAMSALQNKLSRLIVTNGYIASTDNTSRFVLVANPILESKDVSATVPAMYGVKLTVNLYFGDGIDGVLFSSTAITISGLERSEEKAYLSALRGLNTQDKSLLTFIEESRRKVKDYYLSRCGQVIKESDVLASQYKFDEALFRLAQVPAISDSCFSRVSRHSQVLFKNKINYECSMTLNKAKTLLASQKFDEAYMLLEQIFPDAGCYKDAVLVLRDIESARCTVFLNEAKASWSSHDYEAATISIIKIPPGSKCSQDADLLMMEIKTWFEKEEKRKLDLELYKYKESQKRAQELTRAIRDIGVAFGQGQPKVVYKASWF